MRSRTCSQGKWGSRGPRTMGRRPSCQRRRMIRCRDDSTSAERTWQSIVTPLAARDVSPPRGGERQ
eukprot:13960569-Heterocapsa_arctica.AAC.1